MDESLTLGGSGLAGVVITLGLLLAAIGTGFIRYLYRRMARMEKDYDQLRRDFEGLQAEYRAKEEIHRRDRDRDARLISSLQNRVVALLVYISGLRSTLATHGIASVEPPHFDTYEATSELSPLPITIVDRPDPIGEDDSSV